MCVVPRVSRRLRHVKSSAKKLPTAKQQQEEEEEAREKEKLVMLVCSSTQNKFTPLLQLKS